MYRYNGEGRANWISAETLRQCNNPSDIFPVTWEEIGDELDLVTGYQGPCEGEIRNLTEVVLCEVELRGFVCLWTKDLRVSYRKLQRLIKKVNPQDVLERTGRVSFYTSERLYQRLVREAGEAGLSTVPKDT